jgi:hypothetical protein
MDRAAPEHSPNQNWVGPSESKIGSVRRNPKLGPSEVCRLRFGPAGRMVRENSKRIWFLVRRRGGPFTRTNVYGLRTYQRATREFFPPNRIEYSSNKTDRRNWTPARFLLRIERDLGLVKSVQCLFCCSHVVGRSRMPERQWRMPCRVGRLESPRPVGLCSGVRQNDIFSDLDNHWTNQERWRVWTRQFFI